MWPLSQDLETPEVDKWANEPHRSTSKDVYQTAIGVMLMGKYLGSFKSTFHETFGTSHFLNFIVITPNCMCWT